MTELQFAVLKAIGDLEVEIAKKDAVDHTGIVTNHMRAAWTARDRINAIFAGADSPHLVKGK